MCRIFVCVLFFFCCIDRICQNQGMIFYSFWGVALAVFFSPLLLFSSFFCVCMFVCLECFNLDRHNYFCLVYCFFTSIFPYLIISWHHFHSNMVRVYKGPKKCVCVTGSRFKNDMYAEYRQFQSMLLRHIQDPEEKM